MKTWYAKPTAGHERHGQSVVIDEETGRDIAIVYDGDADAQLLAAAPELLEALKAVLECGSLNPNHLHKFGKPYQQAEFAIDLAEGRQ